MKAIRVSEFGGPEKLLLTEVPGLKPSAGEVLVEVHAVGVNPVETYIRSGAYAHKPSLPYTPGADGAGKVLAVGSGVKSVRAGDRVYLSGSLTGSYAEQALCTAAQVHPLPEGVSYAQGAAMGVPYGTAYRALFHKAHLQSGETVLVHGASGGVGVAAVQLAHAAGGKVIGTAGTDRGRQLVKVCGADHVLDHAAADLAAQVLAATGGNGPDVILEMLANRNLAADLVMIARYGRIVIIGNRGTIEINPRDAMAKDAVLYGMTLFNVPPPELAEIHKELGKGLAGGSLKPVIGQQIPLAEAARAHQAVMQPGSYGKIVLLP